MKELTITPNDAGQRLDKFLQKAFPDLPMPLCYKYIRTKRIKICGKRAQNGQKLSVGETVQLYIGDEFLGGKNRRPLFMAACGQPDILYEDDNILLLNKPAGLLCHEDEREKRDTLINRVLHYLWEKGAYRPEEESSFTPALCNRIDRNTQGIVIAAKNAAALREMDALIRERKIEKRYLCIVLGQPPKEQDVLQGWHTRDENTRTVRITSQRRPGAKSAVTEYRVLCRSGGLALLEVVLHTGRTHQIRAHLAAVGCPLLGDLKYGTARENAAYGRSRQALCSYALRFGALADQGCLDYLEGKCFAVRHVDFVGEYFGEKGGHAVGRLSPTQKIQSFT